MKTKKIIAVGSTGGSVLNEILKIPEIKEVFKTIITDRNCGLNNVAERHQINLVKHYESNSLSFSNFVCKYAISENIDFIVSFYLKLFKGELLHYYKNKLFNLHPSILPAFPGFNPIERAIEYGALFLGTSIHIIDESIDFGKPIIQTIIPFDGDLSIEKIRHKIFLDQCKSLIQLILWIKQDRLQITGNRPKILNANYDDYKFSPRFEDKLALDFSKL